MQHLGTQRLETPRLVLRRLTAGDAPAMYANWASDDDVTKFLMWPTHESIQASGKVLGDWIARYDNVNFYLWAIALRGAEDNPVGTISVVRSSDKTAMAHIGYCIGKKW